MATDLAGLRRKGDARTKPISAVVYGVGGIGKTTFAANSASPVFLCVEDGLGDIENEVDSYDMVDSTYRDILDKIVAFQESDHDWKTLIIDSIDWLEPKIWAETCARGDGTNAWPDVEFPGFGKGYTAANAVWREFLKEIGALQRIRNMNVILIAHSQVKTFNSPEVESFDRYEPKLHKGASGLVHEWSDLFLFCNYRVSIVKDQKGLSKKNTRTRGVGGGQRIGYTNERPAWVAKQRFNLPDSVSLDLGFSGVLDIIRGKVATPDADSDEQEAS